MGKLDVEQWELHTGIKQFDEVIDKESDVFILRGESKMIFAFEYNMLNALLKQNISCLYLQNTQRSIPLTLQLLDERYKQNMTIEEEDEIYNYVNSLPLCNLITFGNSFEKFLPLIEQLFEMGTRCMFLKKIDFLKEEHRKFVKDIECLAKRYKAKVFVALTARSNFEMEKIDEVDYTTLEMSRTDVKLCYNITNSKTGVVSQEVEIIDVVRSLIR